MMVGWKMRRVEKEEYRKKERARQSHLGKLFLGRIINAAARRVRVFWLSLLMHKRPGALNLLEFTCIPHHNDYNDYNYHHYYFSIIIFYTFLYFMKNQGQLTPSHRPKYSRLSRSAKPRRSTGR
jgi:hypothetical protein